MVRERDRKQEWKRRGRDFWMTVKSLMLSNNLFFLKLPFIAGVNDALPGGVLLK